MKLYLSESRFLRCLSLVMHIPDSTLRNYLKTVTLSEAKGLNVGNERFFAPVLSARRPDSRRETRGQAKAETGAQNDRLCFEIVS